MYYKQQEEFWFWPVWWLKHPLCQVWVLLSGHQTLQVTKLAIAVTKFSNPIKFWAFLGHYIMDVPKLLNITTSPHYCAHAILKKHRMQTDMCYTKQVDLSQSGKGQMAPYTLTIQLAWAIIFPREIFQILITSSSAKLIW